ncbi:nuclear transport factor 2 family protein [Rhodophyticola sp. SM2404]
MSLFNKWWDAANALDRPSMEELLDDSFIFVRHNTGEKMTKNEFIDYLMTGVRDQVKSEARRLIYENDEIIVSHSILDGPAGRNAVMLVRVVKDGKITRMESGATPLSLQ